MSLPFDATLKDLGAGAPADFLTEFDQPPAGPTRVLNVDLSTVTTAADLVVGVGAPLAEVIHLDFQSSAAAWKHADVLVYNALLHAAYHVAVHSVVILLRPQAAHSHLNGLVSYSTSSGRGSMTLRYEVVRLWERPAERFLTGALGMTPFAMLGALPQGVSLEDGLAATAQRPIERIDREAPADQGRKLLTAAFVLTGLRVRRDVARQIFRGVRKMKDSDTYLAIIDEGREEEVKKLIRLVGEKRFGNPDESVLSQITGITDLERLEQIMLRLHEVTNWQELLATP